MASCETVTPTLSVIVPNYNHGRLLLRAVNALLAQERAADEIIIVDDGSTEPDREEVLEEISSKAPSVRVLRNATNQGVIHALNRGIEASSGRYLLLGAADDWVLPGFFDAAMRMLERYPEAGLACGEVNLISEIGGEDLGVRPSVRPARRPTYFPPAAVAKLLQQSDYWILTGAAILSRASVRAAGALAPELGSFADGFLVRKIAVTHGFCYLPQRVATWRVSDASVSRRTAFDPAEARRILLTAVAHIDADPCFPPGYSKLFDRRYRFAVCRLAVNAKPMNEVVLGQMGARSRIDRFVVSTLCGLKLFHATRWLLLGWLWLRLRPFKLRSVFWSLASKSVSHRQRAPHSCDR